MSHLGFIEQVLGAAAERAVALAAGPYRLVSLKAGDPAQVVTPADRAISELIARHIRQTYPDHRILDEEHDDHSPVTGATWVVDPIDGSSNYAAGSPLYGVMLGLVVDGTVVASGVALPALGETYLAQRGHGASVNGTALPTVEPPRQLSAALVAYGIDPADPDTVRADVELAAAIAAHCRGLRSANSVFDLMMVARGVYGAFLHRNTRIWDNVAPQLIVEEAGHRYTDLHGAPLRYHRPAAPLTVRAGSTQVHQELDPIVRRWSSCRSG